MSRLKILFQGICTHFLRVVPGVPHRVVLPDASPFRFGMVSLLSEPSVFYFLMPHFAFLRTWPPVQLRLHVPAVMESGNMYGGARLHVRNAVGDQVDDQPFVAAVPPITDYVEHYEWSDDVVVGGNAICYFDLFSGTVEKLIEPNHAGSVVATVETDGPPVLSVTSFADGSTHAIPLDVDDFDHAYLLVGNNGVDCLRPDSQQNFDFLLHYLTAKTGIPSHLIQPTPGMVPPLRSFTPEELHDALPALERLRFPERYFGHCFEELTVGDFAARETAAADGVPRFPGSMSDATPACSDTRYP